MKACLNSLQELMLVQQSGLLPDHEGGFNEEWQDVGRLWVKREMLQTVRRRMGRVTRSYRLRAKYLEEPIYVFSARRGIPIKAGMRLKGMRMSYAVIEDAQERVSHGWQQFCGIALNAYERG